MPTGNDLLVIAVCVTVTAVVYTICEAIVRVKNR